VSQHRRESECYAICPTCHRGDRSLTVPWPGRLEDAPLTQLGGTRELMTQVSCDNADCSIQVADLQ